MLDNELIKLFRPILLNGLAERGFNNVKVEQSNQPTQQGTEITPCLYFDPLFSQQYGFPYRINKIITGDILSYTELQAYETTFQITGLVTQNPADTDGYTAKDIVGVAAEILRCRATIDLLAEAKVGILRVSTLRNLSFVNDKGRYQYSPSFDFILTHKQTRIIQSLMVDSIQSGIYPV